MCVVYIPYNMQLFFSEMLRWKERKASETKTRQKMINASSIGIGTYAGWKRNKYVVGTKYSSICKYA